MLGYLQQIISNNGMLSMLWMLNWSKDPSWRRKKGRKKTPSDEPTVPSVQASEHLVHCAGKMKFAPLDEPTVLFSDAPDELQRRSSKASSTGWSDGLSEDTVGLSDAQFESRQRRAKTTSSAPDEPTPWVRDSVGLSDGHEAAFRDVLARSLSAPDEPTHRRCNASEQLCQRIVNGSSDATLFSGR
jgi:hypothetical protein